MKTKTDSTSIRTAICKIISSIIPIDPCEEEHLAFVNDWIASGVEIFRSETPNKPDIHLVSYFIVVDLYTKEFLLVDHKRAQLWLPPGGHVEINEHPKATVIREAREELGIEADFLYEDPLFLTMTSTSGNTAAHTDVSLWYILKGHKSEAFKFDTDEFHSIRWFKQEDIPFERSDLHMRRFLKKFLL